MIVEEAYFAQFEPNMVAAVNLFRLTFDEYGVDYAATGEKADAFEPISEEEWDALNMDYIVQVEKTILDIWEDKYPLGYNKVREYAL